MSSRSRVPVALDAVPETLLWTLHHRAAEAARPDGVLRDPLAVEVAARVDPPLEQRFGAAGGLGQWQALRVRAFDAEVRRFQRAHPGSMVVALGEGLETQSWRTDDGARRWLTVELPEVAALREQLLPASPRHATVAASATDTDAWMDAVDASRGVLLTAQGLLMYLQPAEVHALIGACARRFAGATLVFDAVPGWLAERSRTGGLRRPGTAYAPPAWHWSLDRAEERRLAALPGVRRLRAVPLPRGRGAAGLALPLAARVPPLRRLMLSVLAADF